MRSNFCGPHQVRQWRIRQAIRKQFVADVITFAFCAVAEAMKRFRPNPKCSVRNFSIWLALPFASMKTTQHDITSVCHIASLAIAT
jgi:hypothetical protein